MWSDWPVLIERNAYRKSAAWTASIALLLIGGFVASMIWLPPVAALCIGGVLALSGVVLFTRSFWRTASLLFASLLLSFAGAEAAFGILASPPVNRDVVKVSTPSVWHDSDPIVGYRPRPNTTVDMLATYGDEIVFHQTYTIDASGARLTPGSRAEGPTYLFIGDSFTFGEGLADDQTLASNFARGLRHGGHVVNLGVLGYAPSHLVRAIETGLYDRYVVGKVAAVVTWIAATQLPRLTGDGGWLGSSPRFVLENGKLRHTGTFNEYRWTHPMAGLSYLGRTYLASVARTETPALEDEQHALFVALMARLRDLVRERYNAPLIVIYDWPDHEEPYAVDLRHIPTFYAIRDLGMPMVSIRKIIGRSDQWSNFLFPHDGHPNPRLAGLAAKDLLAVVDR